MGLFCPNPGGGGQYRVSIIIIIIMVCTITITFTFCHQELLNGRLNFRGSCTHLSWRLDFKDVPSRFQLNWSGLDEFDIFGSIKILNADFRIFLSFVLISEVSIYSLFDFSSTDFLISSC